MCRPIIATESAPAALAAAAIAVALELVVLACVRWRFFHTGLLRSFASVTLGGAISVALGSAAG
jgi:hypothetical protein